MASREASRVRSIVGGTVGNLVEWYDFYVYSAFSLYFAHVFFPKGDATAQLLNVAAVFAIGFLMRPVGGWLLGVYADSRGRKAALTLSVLLMCGGSGVIALTPGFDQIGLQRRSCWSSRGCCRAFRSAANTARRRRICRRWRAHITAVSSPVSSMSR